MRSVLLSCFDGAVLAGVLTSLILAHAAPGTAAGQARCKPQVASALHYTRGPTSAKEVGLTLYPRQDVELRVAEKLTVTGAGAHCLTGWIAGFLAFDGGGTFKMRPDLTLISRDRDRTPFAVHSAVRGPFFYGAASTSATRLSPSPFNPHHLGIWPAPTGSSIALFSLPIEKGSAPQVLARSAFRLRGLSYFPAPDGPAGTLAMIRDLSPERVEVIISGIVDRRPVVPRQSVADADRRR